MTDHHRIRYELATDRASGRTLDVACGVGYGSQMLLQKSSVVVGVDVSKEALAWAEHYFPGPTFVCGRIEDGPWEGKFETVVSIETIEHLKEPGRALEAFRKACVGKFIASVPNEEKYPFKAENFSADEWPHYRHYTPKEFDDLLVSHGFTVNERLCQVSKTEPCITGGTDGIFLVYVCT